MKKCGIDQLTEREKDCLRRWLAHQTAKEMALDLGISPHAVEKRLKMARAKLGVTSSLEAARLLADFEGYQRSGSQSPDLVMAMPQGQERRTKPLVLGALAMSLSVAALILVAVHSSSRVEVAPAPATDGTRIDEHYPPSDYVKATPAEILVIIQDTFRTLDADHSGFLEGDESPMVVSEGGNPSYRRGKDGRLVPTEEVDHPTREELRAGFYKNADRNGDGKVSLAEYRRWAGPNIAREGIPAEWKADINRPIPSEPPSPVKPG